MNTPRLLRHPSLVAGLFLASFLHAAEPAPEGRPKAEPFPAGRSGPRPEMARPRDETRRVAFLGVRVADVPPVLGAQLGLAPETGLAVVHVAGRSPASAALKPHDVLTRLDDQQLIDVRQLSVLVRNHQEGDEVTLTLIRGGQKLQSKVRLGGQDLPLPGDAGAVGRGGGPDVPGGGRRMGPGPGPMPGGHSDEEGAPRQPEGRGRPGRMMFPDGMQGPVGPMQPKAI